MAFSNPASGASTAARRRYSSSDIADMNMLPMIDVMLVLLIMFMVAAPLLTHAVKVNLPNSSSSAMPSDTQPVNIVIQADGIILLNQQAFSAETLKPALMLLASPVKQPAVQIYADKTVPYGTVAQVMGALSQVGLNQLRFATSPIAP